MKTITHHEVLIAQLVLQRNGSGNTGKSVKCSCQQRTFLKGTSKTCPQPTMVTFGFLASEP